ncbi:MAG: DUF2848 domain-containing protein [Alphaproteobacteria bacterium]|nr:DUF2848 domain-containing protein [Alphaproteobacteria bacterium]
MPIFERHSQSGELLISFEALDLVMAGWTGRDEAALRHHIEELQALGVHPPSKTPLFYRIDPGLLTGAVEEIKVVGKATSGEAEAVVLSMADGLWVGLGSDHTDRAFEAHSVQLSKQLCRKPMAGTLWSYDEVIDHWDELILRAHIVENGERVLYQEGALASVRRPEELMASYRAELDGNDAPLPVGTALFSGTLPAIGGIRPSSRFEMELEDPILARSMSHAFSIATLPEIS